MASGVREIARLAGVSVATVSRVANGGEGVRPQTCRRVEEAMAALGVGPGDLVRRKASSGRLVGLLLPDLTNSFFAEMAAGADEVAREKGWDLVICHTREDDQTEIHYLHLLRKAGVCGLIATPTSDDDDSLNNEYMGLLGELKIPIVLVDRDEKSHRFHGIFVDNRQGAAEATRALLNNGHRKIALIGGPENTIPGRSRAEGYRAAFEKRGLAVDESLVFRGDFSIAAGAAAAREILERRPDCTAIFSANNTMTLGCLSVLSQRGLRLGEDMALIGFDDIPPLEMAGLPLSTVGRPTREMGRRAMELLVEEMSGRCSPEPRRIILPPRLVLRGSERMGRQGSSPDHQ